MCHGTRTRLVRTASAHLGRYGRVPKGRHGQPFIQLICNRCHGRALGSGYSVEVRIAFQCGAFLRLGHSASRRAREDFCRFACVEMQLRLFLRRLLKPST